MLAQLCRLSLCLLIPALLFTPEAFAQQSAPESSALTKPAVEALSIETSHPHLRPGQKIHVKVIFRANEPILGPANNQPEALNEVFHVDREVVLIGKPVYSRKLGTRMVEAHPEQVLQPGVWSMDLNFSISENTKAGRHDLSGEVNYRTAAAPALGQQLLVSTPITVAPYQFNKWNLVWMIPLFAILLPLLPVFLLLMATGAISDC